MRLNLVGVKRRGLQWLAAALWLFCGPGVSAEVPEPLSLQQALEFADGHPRAVYQGQAPLPPRGQPLYLDCHSLAYAGTPGNDPRRNRPGEILLAPRTAQRLEILLRFLDVLLADQAFSRYDEANAVAYIQYDRAREREALGQVSELRVEELNALFLEVRHKRAAAEAAQRLTRALLARALGRPEDLPRDLLPAPALQLPDKPPEAKQALAAAMKSNRWLAEGLATLGGERRRVLEMELGQQILELVLRLQVLQDAGRYAVAETLRRDLKLEQSRVLYEKELKADLGFSMSAQTRARLREQRVEFCNILTWAELNALQGKPLLSHEPPAAETKKP